VTGAADGVQLREATPADVPAITHLYAHHVLTGTGSFEEEPPDAAEMARRLAEVQGHGLPWLVAVGGDGALAGYAYAGRFHVRSAYRLTVEDSVYVAAGHTGRGVGRRLLTALIARCAALGRQVMVARIGDAANAASIALHAALGFREVGRLEGIGLKFGRRLDVVLMQRELG
jgi:phosphinothricin acetyltransferase